MKRLVCVFTILVMVLMVPGLVVAAEQPPIEDSDKIIEIGDGTCYWLGYHEGKLFFLYGMDPSETGYGALGPLRTTRNVNGYWFATMDDAYQDLYIFFSNGKMLEVEMLFAESPFVIDYITKVYEYQKGKPCVEVTFDSKIYLWYMFPGEIPYGDQRHTSAPFAKNSVIAFHSACGVFYASDKSGKLFVLDPKTHADTPQKLGSGMAKGSVPVDGGSYLGWLGKKGELCYTTDGASIQSFTEFPKGTEFEFYEGVMVAKCGAYFLAKIVPGEAPASLPQTDYEALCAQSKPISPFPETNPAASK